MISSIRLLMVLLGSLLALALLAGCGGGGTGGNGLAGGVQLRIRWADLTRTELPAATAGVRITVLVDEEYFPSFTRWVARPEGEDVTTVTLLGIPAGEVMVRMDAYSTSYEYDANSNLLLATGLTSFTIAAGQHIDVAVTLTPVDVAGTITGIVTDGSTEGTPALEGVTVTTSDGVRPWTTTTDADGRYTLTGVPSGQRVVSFTKEGWESLYEQTVLGEEAVTLDASMAFNETTAPDLPGITVNEPVVNQEIGIATLTGTITNMDAPFAALVLNGNETLIALSGYPYITGGRATYSFAATAILAPGDNTLAIRATNARGTTITLPLTVTFTPTGGDYLFRVTLSWDGGGDLDLHTWNPALEHSFYGNAPITGGTLDVDNTWQIGPENFTCTALADGRFRVAVNNFNGAEGRNATIRVTVNHGPNAGQSYTFGPYAFTAANGNIGYPITGNTAAWWRPCDIVVAGDTITAVAPDATELPEGAVAGARRSKDK